VYSNQRVSRKTSKTYATESFAGKIDVKDLSDWAGAGPNSGLKLLVARRRSFDDCGGVQIVAARSAQYWAQQKRANPHGAKRRFCYVPAERSRVLSHCFK
jgi:hypothetical protein